MNKQHPAINTSVIGKGYRTIRFVGAEKCVTEATAVMEILFWVHPKSGNVHKSPESRVSSNFHKFPSSEWEIVGALPEGCEFIGNYHMPAGLF